MKRVALPLFVVCAIGVSLFAVGYKSGEYHEAVKRDNPALWKSSYYSKLPIAKDAVRRWSEKVHETPDKAMEGRLVSWLGLLDRSCISLDLTPGSIGGVPVYCYAVSRIDGAPRQTMALIAEYSDVD